MATKCIVLGQPEALIDVSITQSQYEELVKFGWFKDREGVKKKGKPIEFDKFLCIDTFLSARTPPSKYDNIELISKGYNNQNQDLIFAYDSDRSYGVLYLGHWNDGFVE